MYLRALTGAVTEEATATPSKRTVFAIAFAVATAVGILVATQVRASASAGRPRENGRIAFRTLSAREVRTIHPDGSNLRTLLRCPPGSRCVFENYAWSPDGKRFAFERGYGFCCLRKGEKSNHPLFVANADGSGEKRVPGCGRPGPDCDMFAWAPDSRRIAVFRGASLYVVDLATGETTRIAQPRLCCSVPAWSPDGSALLLATESVGGGPRIWRMNADGSGATKLVDGAAPQWSPDGTRIAFDAGNGIYTMDSDGSHVTALIQEGVAREGTSPGFPAWSPDGQRIAFGKSPDTTPGKPGGFVGEIWMIRADGTQPKRLARSQAFGTVPVWSPDGKLIAFTDASGNRVYLVGADGEPGIRLLARDAAGFAWQPISRPNG
jgi:Tol biopolymer transport system component